VERRHPIAVSVLEDQRNVHTYAGNGDTATCNIATPSWRLL
jgi:hypothetical protein